MKPYIKSKFNFLLAAVLLMATSCVIPVNTFMESARTLEQGAVEFTGSYAKYSISDEGESESLNSNFGLRVGYGLTDRFNLRVRYIRMIPEGEDGGSVNYMAVSPKFSLKENVFALTTPIGAYFGEGDPTWFFSPRIILTHSLPNDKFDFSFSSKVDFYLEEDVDPTIGFNIGAGLSTDLNRWAIRPEVGLLFNTDSEDSAKYWAFGVGLTYNISN